MANTKITAANIDSTSTGFTLADLTVDTTTLVVDATNNRVGIGTNSPSVNLHVSDSTDARIVLDDVGSGSSIQIRSDGASSYIGTTSNTDLRLVANNAEKMRIDSSGNVGIGTTSITNVQTPTLQLGTNRGAIAIGTGDIQDNGSTLDIGSPRPISFSISSSEKMRIDSSGNVGIGTTGPTHTLHVQGTSNDTIDETKGTMKVQASGGNGMIFGTIASSPFSSYIQSAYVIDTSLAQYNLALNPIGGNVGIGTTNPASKLTVDGATTGFAASGITLKRTGTLTGSSDIILAGNSGSEALSLRVNQSEKLRVTHDGNVGIGSTAPDKLLTVQGADAEIAISDTNNTPLLRFRESGTTKATIRTASGALVFDAGGAIERMRIDSSGDTTFSGNVTADNLKRNNDTNSATAESGEWLSTTSYIYDGTNGSRQYWNRILTIAASNCRGIIEYEAKSDENYPFFVKGTIAYAGFNGGASFSVQHDQQTGEGTFAKVRVDTSRGLWIQTGAIWAHTLRWRVTNYGSAVSIDTSWTTGTNRYDPLSNTNPPNSSSDILGGQNLRATSSSVTGSVPTYNQYRSLGQYIATGQPSFMAYNGSNEYVTGTGTYEAVFPSTLHNIGSHYSTSTGRFTAPVAGRYLFTYQGLHDSFSSSTGFEWRINASDPNWGEGYVESTRTYEMMSASIILNLSANDFVSMFIRNSTRIHQRYGVFSGQLLG